MHHMLQYHRFQVSSPLLGRKILVGITPKQVLRYSVVNCVLFLLLERHRVFSYHSLIELHCLTDVQQRIRISLAMIVCCEKIHRWQVVSMQCSRRDLPAYTTSSVVTGDYSECDKEARLITRMSQLQKARKSSLAHARSPG